MIGFSKVYSKSFLHTPLWYFTSDELVFSQLRVNQASLFLLNPSESPAIPVQAGILGTGGRR